MTTVPKPREEAERLLDVADLAAFDRTTEELLGAFVRVASDLVGAPISAVTMVGEHEHFAKAALGLTFGTMPREDAFCSHAIQRPDEVMVVPDLRADPRFSDSALVTGSPNLRFYAGAPLKGRRGGAVGTLCVMDDRPRTLTPAMVERLRDLALGVSAALSLRSAIGEVYRSARTDPLTGAVNRKALEEMLGAMGPEPFGLLMIDLDGFKPINDTYGHAGGDRALVEVTRRLREVVRRDDTVARLGGDEFVVLTRNLDRPEVGLALAGRIHASLADTFVINGSPVPLRASIGFAGLPWHAADPQALMERADAALYVAKRAGRGVTRSADAAPDGALPGRAALEAQLRSAFAPGGKVPFHLVFQPIVEVASGRIASVEALLRWRTEDGAMVSPADLLPVIEGMGYSGALDRWVIGEACRLIALGHPPYTISVNASAGTFGMPCFDAQVETLLRQHGVTGDRLMIEMTEGSLVGDHSVALENMRGLERLGVRVSLDDFGGGHGSLVRLRGYPFAAIKLDGSLVENCARDPQGAVMIGALAEMARSLSIPVVGERVEEPAQLAVLARAGVAQVQGYLLSRPLPWDQLLAAEPTLQDRFRAALRP